MVPPFLKDNLLFGNGFGFFLAALALLAFALALKFPPPFLAPPRFAGLPLKLCMANLQPFAVLQAGPR